MKTKRTFLSILTLCIALLFTACSGKGTAGTESSNTKTESGSKSADDSNSKLNDLYQQENQIFADHKDVWDKAFGMMSKSAADQNGNYADYLADTIESNKESFTDDELKTLTADIETIRKIEEQIAKIEKKNTGSDNTDQKNSSKACVAELSKLNELNDAIKSMGGEVVGINTETFDGNKTAIKEAKTILESQGAKYRNLSIDSSSDAGKYASDIMAFPTTILVDRNGNIVGDPMLGGIDNQDNYDTLMKQIQSVIDADSTKK